jgi:23S rRNA pseudouridine2605 synthase
MAGSMRRGSQADKAKQGIPVGTRQRNSRKTEETSRTKNSLVSSQRTAQGTPQQEVAKQAPAGRARRLQVRRGSQQYETAARDLRDKRVDKHHIEAQRLQKVLAFSGLGSRRDMEALIESGRVDVNGKVAELGVKVGPQDTVRIDGKGVRLKWQDRLPRIVLYHKQEGELVSRDDPKGRQTIFDRLPRLQSSQWVAVGRLDYNTSGLLVLTTSGELANRMLHPRFEVEREYAVRLIGELDEAQRKALTQGIELEDGPAKFERLEDLGGEGLNHWYRVVIHEGRNREVRRMFAHFQFTVSRLMRTRFGAIFMPPRLKRGQFYELNEPEVLSVLRWAGLQMNGMAKREKGNKRVKDE